MVGLDATAASGRPHEPQYVAPGVFSAWQNEQFIRAHSTSSQRLISRPLS